MQKKKRVVVLSSSNGATDNVLQALHDFEPSVDEESFYKKYLCQRERLKMVRVGSVARCKASLKQYNLLTKIINKGYDWKNHKKNKFDFVSQIFEKSNVFFMTLSMNFLSNYFKRYLDELEKKIDYVIIDEAGQALHFMTIMGIHIGEKIILAGDHHQLPPTILNRENSFKHETLFEILIDKNKKYAKKHLTLLRTQYRMNRHIMKTSSDVFYEGKLEAHESVRNEIVKHKDLTLSPLNILDTYGYYIGENKKESKFDSTCNQGEA